MPTKQREEKGSLSPRGDRHVVASFKVKLRYKLLTELGKKKMGERGDKQSEGFDGGSREISLGGQIKRKWNGQHLKGSIPQCRQGFPVYISIMLSTYQCQPQYHTSSKDREERSRPKEVRLINSKGENGGVRFHAFYQGFVFLFGCC